MSPSPAAAGDARQREAAAKLRSTVTSLSPDVPYLTYPEFQSLSSSALLVDVRSPGEVSAGTIPGSISPAAVRAVLSLSPPSRPVVAFCTIGLRSAAYVRRLRGGQGRPLYNYSVMEHVWAGGTLERPDGRPWQRVVHTYTNRYAAVFPENVRKESYKGWKVVKNVLPALPALLAMFVSWGWRRVLGAKKEDLVAS